MHRHEHADAYDRRCREVASRYWWNIWGPVVRAVLAGIALAAGMWLASLTSDCGNVPDAGADPVPVLETHPPPAPVDGEAFALAARMRAWQPLWRARHAGELEEVTAAVVRACRAAPWPSPERCPDLLLALCFRESSLRADAVGALGEVGVAQLHGPALAGETREAAMDLDTNLRLALAWLRRSAFHCHLAGRDSVEAAISMYGSGRCRSYRGARLLLRWEAALRSAGGVSPPSRPPTGPPCANATACARQS